MVKKVLIDGTDKIIPVYSPSGKIISYCTPKRAYKIVFRGNAKWISSSAIKMNMSTDEKNTAKKKIINSSVECYICGVTDMKLTIDHIIPRALGGSDKESNLKACCKYCNKQKGSMLLKDFIEYISLNRNNFKNISDDRLSFLRIKYIEGKE